MLHIAGPALVGEAVGLSGDQLFDFQGLVVDLALAVHEGAAAVLFRHLGVFHILLALPAEVGHVGHAVLAVVPAQAFRSVVGNDDTFFGAQPVKHFQRTLGVLRVGAQRPGPVAALRGNGLHGRSGILDQERGEAFLVGGALGAVVVSDDPAPQGHQVAAAAQLLGIGVEVLGNGFRIEQALLIQLVVHLQGTVVQAAFIQGVHNITGRVVDAHEVEFLVAVEGHQVPRELHDAVFPVAEAAVGVNGLSVSVGGHGLLQCLQECRQIFQGLQFRLSGLLPRVEANLQRVGRIGQLGPGAVLHGYGAGEAVSSFIAGFRAHVGNLLDGILHISVDVRIVGQIDVAPVQNQVCLHAVHEIAAHLTHDDDVAQFARGHRGSQGIGIHVRGDDLQRNVEAVLQLLGEPAALLAGEVRQLGEHGQGDGLTVVFRDSRDGSHGDQEHQGENEGQDLLHGFLPPTFVLHMANPYCLRGIACFSATSIFATAHRAARLFRLNSPLTRFPPPAVVRGSSATSNVAIPHHPFTAPIMMPFTK